MARMKAGTLLCRACIKDVPAVETIDFAAYGHKYRIPLCELHVRRFERDIDGWIPLADEMAAEEMQHDRNWYRQQRNNTTRLRAVLDDAKAEATAEANAQRRLLEIEAEERVSQGWSIDEYAEKRADALGVSMADILLTATSPDHVYGQSWRNGDEGENIATHVRESCRLTVDKANKYIIDVWILAEDAPIEDRNIYSTTTPERTAV